MGRRIGKSVYRNDLLTSRLGFVYKGYVQIAEVNTMGASPRINRQYLWDPSEPVATRPLAMLLPENEDCYFTHDAMKNVDQIIDQYGNLRAQYEYSPFGEVSEIYGGFENPFRFSSEYHDDELGLVYYNYRHYNPIDGRWIHRAPIAEKGGWNLYGFARNEPLHGLILWGLQIKMKYVVMKKGI